MNIIKMHQKNKIRKAKNLVCKKCNIDCNDVVSSLYLRPDILIISTTTKCKDTNMKGFK